MITLTPFLSLIPALFVLAMAWTVGPLGALFRARFCLGHGWRNFFGFFSRGRLSRVPTRSACGAVPEVSTPAPLRR